MRSTKKATNNRKKLSGGKKLNEVKPLAYEAYCLIKGQKQAQP